LLPDYRLEAKLGIIQQIAHNPGYTNTPNVEGILTPAQLSISGPS